MKKIVLFAAGISLAACAELQQVASQLPTNSTTGTTTAPNSGIFSNADISAALKQALNKGVENQVAKLTATDGFFKDQAVKILLPEELQKVDQSLRKVGMGALADEGLKVLNRAAENAVKEATPIFVDAIKNMSITDAKNILMGGENAATSYLKKSTEQALYAKFSPVVQSSLTKVGADKVWGNLISKYNNLPLTEDVNPDLTDYVTQRAMQGVFTKIAVEEKEIRTNLNARSNSLLQGVFAMQDKK